MAIANSSAYTAMKTTATAWINKQNAGIYV